MNKGPPESGPPDSAALERLRAVLRTEEISSATDVDAERIWQAVRRELPAAERRAVVARVAADPAWAMAWRLAHALSDAAARTEATVAPLAPVIALAPRRLERLRTRLAHSGPVWGALAAVLLVVVGGVVVMERRGDESARTRGKTDEALTSALPDAAALPRTAFTLRWTGVPQATLWSVQVSSEDLAVVHHVEGLKAREYAVPETVLAPLASGARVLWQVEAHLPDGSTRRSSTFVNVLK